MTSPLLALLALLAPAFAVADSPPRIAAIRALPDRLIVRLSGPPKALRLEELRPWQSGRAGSAPTVWAGVPRAAAITIPRAAAGHDRIYCRFQLVDGRTGHPLGPPHWVDDMDSIGAPSFAMPWPAEKKGISCPVDLEDLKELGARYADQGVLLAGIFDWSGDPPRETWEVDGRKLPINTNYIADLDRQIRRMTELGINVTLIPVNGVPDKPDPTNPLINPRTDLARTPYRLGAFNLTDERGMIYYRAAFEYLAHRYSDPANKNGWVSGYVVGNELQSHWAWHNMGLACPEDVTREYADQLRVAWLAVRRFHRSVRVYASLDHTWAAHLDPNPLKSMRGDRFLEDLSSIIRAGGDFPWHVAFHPYPEDLFQPRFWNDRTALRSLDSPRITFRNLEALPAFLARPTLLYRGKPRRIILSEQGFHLPDGPDGEQVQAAAFVLAWWKVSRLPTIDAFIYHRHIDHRDQGGLRLGLWSRKLDSASPEEPDSRRLIYTAFRTVGTPGWRAALAYALPVAGITAWPEDRSLTAPIPARSPRRPRPIPPRSLVASLIERMDDVQPANCLAWRMTWEEGPGAIIYPAILQHPNGPGPLPGEARFQIALPRISPAERLSLRFGTVVTGPTVDGVRMSVALNGREAWSIIQAEKDHPALHTLDLTRFAGATVELGLRVDCRVNNAGDWSNWLDPVLVRIPAR